MPHPLTVRTRLIDGGHALAAKSAEYTVQPPFAEITPGTRVYVLDFGGAVELRFTGIYLETHTAADGHRAYTTKNDLSRMISQLVWDGDPPGDPSWCQPGRIGLTPQASSTRLVVASLDELADADWNDARPFKQRKAFVIAKA